MDELEIRTDEQRKLGKALQDFLNNREVRFNPSGLAALDDIVADMAKGNYDTSQLLSEVESKE